MIKQELETILVVDDNYADRALLRKIFSGTYRVAEAKNGVEALEALRGNEFIVAVVLDLFMPELDGFGVLSQMRNDEALREIPVVVITADDDDESQIRALDMGARDVVIKPFSPKPVLARIRNITALQRSHMLDVEKNILQTRLEQREKQLKMLELDSMTGLYNRGAFIYKASEMIKQAENGSYILVCMDVDNFKVINDQYGIAVGDKVLRHIAERISDFIKKYGGIASRTSADNYAVLAPADAAFMLTGVSESLTEAFKESGIHINAHISTGCYYIDSASLSVGVMLDRALMAKRSAKGRYDVSAVFFTSAMRESLLEDQWIISMMETGLREKQFEVWYQPQYDHSVGQLIGAEALSRWRHPEKGLISPGLFIPLFEGNGFIYALDQYVWTQVCEKLREWLNAGCEPLPVSVNVSRFDLLEQGFLACITGIVEKYDIPKDLFRLEITESALAKSTMQVINVVRGLSQSGFTIEIDDFGSGYSSFTTLKNVPADILKLDMQFLSGDGDAERGGSIIESIVRMAKWLNMPVIAEGVEHRSQADFLCSIGCSRVQGYLYSRPVPVSEYEKLLKGGRSKRFLPESEGFGISGSNAFWDLNSIETLIFNRFAGGACVFEYHSGKLELLRVNDSFAAAFGTELSTEQLLRIDPVSVFSSQSMQEIRAALERAIQSLGVERGEAAYTKSGGGAGCIRYSLRLITQSGGHYLFHGYVESTTAQRSAERRLECGISQLQTVLDNMEQGVTAIKLVEGKACVIFANSAYYAQLGYTREQLESESPDIFELIHPDDRAAIRERALQSNKLGRTFSLKYRVITRGGGTARIACRGKVVEFDGIAEPVQLAVYSDITAKPEKEALRGEFIDALPCGAGVFRLEGGKIKAEYLNRRYWRDTDRRISEFDAENAEKNIHPDDLAAIKRLLREKLETESESERAFCAEARILRHGSYERFRIEGGVDADGLIYVLFIPRGAKDIAVSQRGGAEGFGAGILDFVTRVMSGGAVCAALEEGFPLKYVSPALADWLGYDSADELINSCGGLFSRLIADGDAEGALAEIKKQLFEKDVYCTEYRLQKKDKNVIWAREYGMLCVVNGEETLVGVCTDATRFKELEEKLRISVQNASYSERLADMALKTINASVWEYDFKDKCIIQRLNSIEMHGFETIVPNVPDSLVQSGFVHPDSAAAFLAMYERLAAGSPFEHGVFRVQKSDRSGYWFEHIRYSSTFDAEGKPLRAVGMSDDVTDEVEAVEKYRHEAEIKHALTPDIVFSAALNVTRETLDEFRADYTRGFPFPENITFENAMDVCGALCGGDESIKYLCGLRGEQLELIYRYGEKKIRREFEYVSGESHLWLRLEINLIKDPSSEELYSFVLVRDIDDDRRERDRLAALAQHDSLTGLLNHGSTHAAIKQRLRANAGSGLCALMIIDIDDFKHVNDTYGHKAGDDVIVETAARISRFFENDIAGRVGGDEFMVLTMNAPDVNAVYARVQRLLEALSEDVMSFSVRVGVQCSIGVAICGRTHKNFDSLYKAADSALYSVKTANKGTFMFVDV